MRVGGGGTGRGSRSDGWRGLGADVDHSCLRRAGQGEGRKGRASQMEGLESKRGVREVRRGPGLRGVGGRGQGVW